MRAYVCVCVCVCIKGEQKEKMNDQQLNNLDLLCRYPLLKIKKSSSTGNNKVKAQVSENESEVDRERVSKREREQESKRASESKRERAYVIDVTGSLSPTVSSWSNDFHPSASLIATSISLLHTHTHPHTLYEFCKSNKVKT